MVEPKYYETLYVTRPDIGEDELNKTRDKLKAAIGKCEGEIVKSEKWAERKLSYSIDNYSEGVYYIMIYKALPGVVGEMEKVLTGPMADVLRFITVAIDQERALSSTEQTPPEEVIGGAPQPKKKKKKNLIAKKKYGRFQLDKLKPSDLDYKNVDLLSKFITERKKIVPKRTSGLSAHGQRLLARAIKRARNVSLLPYTVLHGR
ncbi:MAG: 30S ribosomal protein S18 [Thermodesulfobacteriota bacterium]